MGFRLRSGRTGYLVWAVATKDGKENNTLSYTLPSAIANGTHAAAFWDYNVTGERKVVRGTITLSGAPTFLIDESEFRDVSGLFDLSDDYRAMVVWPNPVSAGSSEINLRLPSSTRAWDLEVFDALGRSVRRVSFSANGKDVNVAIPAEGLPSGSYQVTAISNDERLVGSFVVLD